MNQGSTIFAGLQKFLKKVLERQGIHLHINNLVLKLIIPIKDLVAVLVLVVNILENMPKEVELSVK